MSPRTREQNDAIKDERREQLLLAALKVFAHRGLAATKIGDIAAAANLSHGLVYHYFKSKDEIFTEIVRRAINSANEAMRMADQLPLEPLDKIRAIASITMKGIGETDVGAYYFYLMVQAYASDAAPAEAKEYMSGFTGPMEVLYRAVAEGQANGQIREGDPMEMVTLFWASVQGLATNKVAAGAHFKLPDSGLLVRMFEPRA